MSNIVGVDRDVVRLDKYEYGALHSPCYQCLRTIAIYAQWGKALDMDFKIFMMVVKHVHLEKWYQYEGVHVRYVSMVTLG